MTPLDEYLVKLGWDIDKGGFDTVEKILSNVESKVNGMGASFTRSFGIAASAVLTFITSTVGAMYGLMTSVLEVDTAAARFSRRMYISKDAAMSMNTALKEMKASYDDLFYMSGEEFSQFLKLKGWGESLETPADMEKTLNVIRGIQTEFQKIKITLQYAQRWIVYYLGKIMGTDLTNAKNKLSGFNDWLRNTLPIWSKYIAEFFAGVYRLGQTVVETFSRLAGSLKKLWDSFTEGQQRAIGAVAGFVGLLKMGPIGMFIAGILALLLVLDDFYTWQRGGKSAWGSTWGDLSDWWGNFFDDDKQQALEALRDKFGQVFDSISKVAKVMADLFKNFVKWAADIGLLDAAFHSIVTVLNGFADLLIAINDLFLIFTGNMDKINETGIIKKLLDATVYDEKGNPDIIKSIIPWIATLSGVYNPQTGEYKNQLLDIDYINRFGDRTSRGDTDFSDQKLTSESMPWLDYSTAALKEASETAVRTFTKPSETTNNLFVPESSKTSSVNNNINVVVNPSPGMNESDLAQRAANKISNIITKQRTQYDPFK